MILCQLFYKLTIYFVFYIGIKIALVSSSR